MRFIAFHQGAVLECWFFLFTLMIFLKPVFRYSSTEEVLKMESKNMNFI